MQRALWSILLISTGWLLVVVPTVDSHTPIASRWNYNEHLFPIFRDNCGSCHRPGGIAPMSLVTYRDAFPWSQSIREEILALRMPPWEAEDGFGDFRNGHSLSAEEMDMILEWSSGGYPQGPRSIALEEMSTTQQWALGPPSSILPVDEPFLIRGDISEVVRYFVVPANQESEQWVTAVDVIPEASSVVRGVTVYIDETGTARSLDEADSESGFSQLDDEVLSRLSPIAVWSPGQSQVARASGTGHRLASGADLLLRVHYKKTWITEGQEFSDQLRVGLYFAEGATSNIESLIVSSPNEFQDSEFTFVHRLNQDVNLLGLLPEIDLDVKDVRIVANTPNGDQIPLLFLREPDTEWPTRYWFESPVPLASGAELLIRGSLPPAYSHERRLSLFDSGNLSPIRILVDYSAVNSQIAQRN